MESIQINRATLAGDTRRDVVDMFWVSFGDILPNLRRSDVDQCARKFVRKMGHLPPDIGPRIWSELMQTFLIDPSNTQKERPRRTTKHSK